MQNQPEREKKDPLEIEDLISDPYEILEIDPSATAGDIKKAYFKKVREHPPEQEPEQFKRIRAAYDMLRTPEARSATDLFMLKPPLAYEPYKRPPSFSLDITEADIIHAAKAKTDVLRRDFKTDFRDVNL
jgi:curved DNA-binding protein CbpA